MPTLVYDNSLWPQTGQQPWLTSLGLGALVHSIHMPQCLRLCKAMIRFPLYTLCMYNASALFYAYMTCGHVYHHQVSLDPYTPNASALFYTRGHAFHLLPTEMPESLEEDWREYFVPMGTSLLDRVLSHHTDLVPLD